MKLAQPPCYSIFATLGLWLLPAAAAPAAETPAKPQHVRQIDLIHFSHTDYGFTDHPAVCRDMQRRYLDIALDAALASQDAPEDARFRWTAETTIAVDDWWQAAGPDRRKQFLAAVACRADRSHRPAAEQHALPGTRAMADDDALAAGRVVEPAASANRRPERCERVSASGCDGVVGSRRALLVLRHQQRFRRPAVCAAGGVLVEDARRAAAVCLVELDVRRRIFLFRDDGMAARPAAFGG